jgi:diguanylate cyclase (GGDEF)-like protein
MREVLFKSTWVLLGIIALSQFMHGKFVGLLEAWELWALCAAYAGYLYIVYKQERSMQVAGFIGEGAVILCIDWGAGVHMAAFLIPLLILRKALDTQVYRLYMEAFALTVVHLGFNWWTEGQRGWEFWIQISDEIFMVGLAAVLAGTVMEMAKSLNQQRERLRLKLGRVEESFQRVKQLADRDGLTGLYNYRAFQEYVENIEGRNFAILLIDVDYFKDFNDQYGHLAGDKVLQCIGEVISENVRREDRVFRYGGEEFAVVLDGADEATAWATAERIRQRVQVCVVEYESQELGGVTISIGISVFENACHSAREIFAQADQALYQAKSKGRNNVVCFYEASLF